MAKGLKETLPDFQKPLLERSLAPEKNVPFLAYWVSRYLTFCRKRDIDIDDYTEAAVIEFLDMLRVDAKILDWQPFKADDALKLYYFHCPKNVETTISYTHVLRNMSNAPKSPLDVLYGASGA